MTVRVLQIIPTLVRGGAEKQMTLLATGLPRDRFDPHVCALTHGGPYEELLRRHEVPVTRIDKRWKVDPAAYWRLRRHIRQLAPDIVQTWIFAANSYGRQAAFASGVRCVLADERCVDPWKSWYELAIDRRLARKTARILTNSTGVRDFYARHGLPAEKFVIIPNGIAPDAAGPPGPSRTELLDQWNLPPDARLVGAVGRLWPQKRYKDLIWATELLKAAGHANHLLIIGEGPQYDALVRFRNDVGLEREVHFLGQRDDVPQILPHLDCFWLGSGYEGQSNALMEAMLAGVPCVVSDIAGNRDLVVPNETGFLVPVGDSGQLARYTQQVLADPALARRLGDAAQQRMRDEFSVSKMVQRHVQLYEHLMQPSPPST